MRRYIILLLITGIVWAQTDFDTLVLKDGTTYLGEYSKTEGKIVFFKPQEAFGFQPIPVKLIKQLQLKDGHFIIPPGLKIEAKYQNKFTNKKKLYTPKNLVGCLIFIIIVGWLIYEIVYHPLGGLDFGGSGGHMVFGDGTGA